MNRGSKMEPTSTNRNLLVIRRTTSVLGLLATGGTIFLMVGLQLYWDEVYLNQRSLSPAEGIMILGILFILLFNISSIVRAAHLIRGKLKSTAMDFVVLLLGLFCILLLIGTKVLSDEIAREYRLGWETTGEWIILYLFLAFQLAYNGLVFFQIYRSDKIDHRQMETT